MRLIEDPQSRIIDENKISRKEKNKFDAADESHYFPYISQHGANRIFPSFLPPTPRIFRQSTVVFFVQTRLLVRIVILEHNIPSLFLYQFDPFTRRENRK